MIAAALLAALSAAVEPSTVPAKGDGVYVAGEAPKPKLKRPIKAKLLPEARGWTPLSLREAGDPGQAVNRATILLKKRGKSYVGQRSKTKAWARAYGEDQEGWLVLAIYPDSLASRRKHFELRFRVVEGYLEKVEAALVTVRRRPAPPGSDRAALRRLGVPFDEEGPASGELTLSAFDHRPGKAARNSGRLRHAAFADPFVGYVDLSWSIKGVEKP